MEEQRVTLEKACAEFLIYVQISIAANTRS